MKKIFVVLLGLALVLSMSGIASAAGDVIEYDSPNNFGTATVSLTLHSIYTVTLPVDIILNDNGNDAFVGNSSFNVAIQRLGANEYMNITVEGTNDGTNNDRWYLQSGASTIEYELGVGEQGDLFDNTRKLTKTNTNKLVEDTNRSVTGQYLHARVLYTTVENLDLSAEYTDKLTFTVNIGTRTNP